MSENKKLWFLIVCLMIGVGSVVAYVTAAMCVEVSPAADGEFSKETMRRLLVDRAMDAISSGARPEAELLAIEAIQLGASSQAKSVLAAFDATPRIRLKHKRDTATCTSIDMSRSGAYYACWKSDAIQVHETDSGRQLWRHRDLPEALTILEQSGHIVARFEEHTFVSHLDNSNRWLREIPAFQRGPFPTVKNAIGWNQSLLVVEPESGRLRRLGACISSIPPAISEDENHLVSVCSLTSYSSVTGSLVKTRSFRSPRTHPAAGVEIEGTGENAYLIDVRGVLSRFSLADGSIHELADTGINMPTNIRLSPERMHLLIGNRRTGVNIHDNQGHQLARLPRYYGAHATFRSEQVVTTVSGAAVATWSIPLTLPANQILFDPPSEVSWARLSPDGEHVLAATSDGTYRVVSRKTHHNACSWSGPDNVDSSVVAWSPNGDSVALGDPNSDSISVLDTNGRVIHQQHLLAAQRIEWLQDGRIIALASPASQLLVLERNSLTEIGRCESDRWIDLSTSPDKAHLVAVDSQSNICAMSQNDSCPVKCVSESKIRRAAIDDTGVGLILAGVRHVVRMNIDGTERIELQANGVFVDDVALSSSGDWAVAATEFGDVLVWGANQSEPLAQLKVHRQAISAVEFSAGSSLLMTASQDSGIRFWGLSVLKMEPAALQKTLETAYGLTLDMAISSSLQ